MKKRIYFKNFTATDKLSFFFLILVQILLICGNIERKTLYLFLAVNTFLIFYLILFCLIKSESKNKIITFLRLFYPAFFIPIIFTEFRFIIPALRPHDLDYILIKLDRLIFGQDPSILVEKYLSPYFVDILQLCYSSFYFMPLITGIYIVKKKEFKEYDFFYFYITYGFFLSYIGYIIVPAIGPRFTLKYLYSTVITGHAIYNFLIKFQNSIEKIHRDCFPSGHTMVVLMVLEYTFKKYRKLFYIFIIPSFFLIMATIFLRYHYFVDLIGGVLFFFFVKFTAEKFYNCLKSKKDFTPDFQ